MAHFAVNDALQFFNSTRAFGTQPLKDNRNKGALSNLKGSTMLLKPKTIKLSLPSKNLNLYILDSLQKITLKRKIYDRILRSLQ